MIAFLLAIVAIGLAFQPIASVVDPAATAVVVVADAGETPAPGDGPAMVSLATVLVAQAQSGKIDRTLFNANMNAALTPTVLASVSGQLAPFGKPTSVTFLARGIAHGYPSYRYRVAWPSRSVDQTFAIDRNGKIAGWLFMPADPSPDAPPSAPPASAPPTR